MMAFVHLFPNVAEISNARLEMSFLLEGQHFAKIICSGRLCHLQQRLILRYDLNYCLNVQCTMSKNNLCYETGWIVSIKMTSKLKFLLGHLKMTQLVKMLFIAELWRPEGHPSGAPYSYGKEKETHEWIFSWFSWLAVLLGGAHARRQRRRRSCATWRPYSK